MNKYIILKSCFLGLKDSEVELNARQAASLIAGRYIAKQPVAAIKGGKDAKVKA